MTPNFFLAIQNSLLMLFSLVYICSLLKFLFQLSCSIFWSIQQNSIYIDLFSIQIKKIAVASFSKNVLEKHRINVIKNHCLFDYKKETIIILLL